MGFGWTFRDNDWDRLRQIVQKISNNVFSPESTVAFDTLNLTTDLTVGGDATITADLSVGGDFSLVGDLVLSGLAVDDGVLFAPSTDIVTQAAGFTYASDVLTVDTDLTLQGGLIVDAVSALDIHSMGNTGQLVLNNTGTIDMGTGNVNITGVGGILTVASGAYYSGTTSVTLGTAGTGVILNFVGSINFGALHWLGSVAEDYFEFKDDV